MEEDRKTCGRVGNGGGGGQSTGGVYEKLKVGRKKCGMAVGSVKEGRSACGKVDEGRWREGGMKGRWIAPRSRWCTW